MSHTVIVDETHESCFSCGGSGQEEQVLAQTSAGPLYATCRQCRGAGFIITKRVTRTITQPAQEM